MWNHICTLVMLAEQITPSVEELTVSLEGFINFRSSEVLLHNNAGCVSALFVQMHIV